MELARLPMLLLQDGFVVVSVRYELVVLTINLEEEYLLALIDDRV